MLQVAVTLYVIQFYYHFNVIIILQHCIPQAAGAGGQVQDVRAAKRREGAADTIS